MKKLYLSMAMLLGMGCSSVSSHQANAETWYVSNTQKLAARSIELMGSPKVMSGKTGASVYFDGDSDRFLVKGSPLGVSDSFTIEAIIKPYDVFPSNKEPRFLHIESVDNPARRFTFELRLNEQHQWYLDAYIKSEKSQFTLIDPNKTHPVGEWVHVAVTYSQGVFTSYVNGIKELEGKVDYLPIPMNADVSIGARLNQIHWFNGEIAKIRFTQQVLESKQFLALK